MRWNLAADACEHGHYPFEIAAGPSEPSAASPGSCPRPCGMLDRLRPAVRALVEDFVSGRTPA